MAFSREYPDRPVIGVGGVIIDRGRTVLIRRGTEPLLGEWSIPGGTIEIGETLEEAVRRELREETGLEVRVLELIEVFDRIYRDSEKKPRFHYVIADYLCGLVGGKPRAGSDVTDMVFAREEELGKFNLTEKATSLLQKAFAMSRARASGR